MHNILAANWFERVNGEEKKQLKVFFFFFLNFSGEMIEIRLGGGRGNGGMDTLKLWNGESL